MNIVDKRKTHSTNNINNRQKFLKRAKKQIKDAVKEALNSKDVKIKDILSGKNIKVPVRDLNEPAFGHSPDDGIRDYVVNGNKDYIKGDVIDKNKQGGGKGGNKASNEGDGEDDFSFSLTKDEFLDFFFDDLELPDFIKKTIKETKDMKPVRAGYVNQGNPSNLDIRMSCKNALGRRIGLHRPKLKEIEELELKLKTPSLSEDEKLKILEEIESLKRKMTAIPWMDPFDIRYKNFTKIPHPITQAVVFCIMDVSSSMSEFHKDIAKRFFMLLYLFLTKKYDKIELRFIRHTQNAKEVDEETFFYSREDGGTMVSAALKLANEIIVNEYPTSDWNIYIAQASDGDNWDGDNEVCLDILKTLLDKVQYMAYIEIKEESYMSGFSFGNSETLGGAYKRLKRENFAVKFINSPRKIFDVFRELFSKKDNIKK